MSSHEPSFRRGASGAAIAAGMLLLTACGGGDSSSSSSAPPSGAHDFSTASPNVVALTVGNGPSAATQAAFNIPYTTVTVCVPSSNTCATINNVLVDTGSTGLRLIKSVLASGGVSLTPLSDPNNSANTIAECLPFADGYAWGSVALATVRIAGESTSAIPIEVIDDSQTPSPPIPPSCSGNGSALNSVTAFDANGVLGVGLFVQDCGAACEGTASNDVYYSCTAAGSCTSVMQSLSEQVSDPVASFAADNNGVILQLPSISANGAASANGYLVFGIGTESNNALNGATVYTTDFEGDFTTSLNGSNLSAFIDSGSNAMFFPDNSIPTCAQSASFYCPTVTLQISATNEGKAGSSGTVNLQVANIENIDPNNFAINDVAGPTTSIPGVGQSYFDWGLPFFYGNTVFVALQGLIADGSEGPYFAY